MLFEGLIFLAGAGAKAIVDVLVKRFAARRGTLDYIKGDCGFFVKAHLDGGRVVEALTHQPELADPTARSFVLRLRGELLNDSDATKLLLAPTVIFVHTSGRHHLSINPTFEVEGKRAASVSLPPHSATQVTVYVTVPRSGLDDTYAQTLPILEFPIPGGEKRLRFKASAASFYGDPIAFWPKHGDKPVIYGSPAIPQSDDGLPDPLVQPTGEKPPAAD